MIIFAMEGKHHKLRQQSKQRARNFIHVKLILFFTLKNLLIYIDAYPIVN